MVDLGGHPLRQHTFICKPLLAISIFSLQNGVQQPPPFSHTPGVVKAATYVPAIPCQSFLAIDDETWEAIVAVAERTRMDFQELAKEAFADLLKKHKQPVGLKAALKESVDERVNRRSKK